MDTTVYEYVAWGLLVVLILAFFRFIDLRDDEKMFSEAEDMTVVTLHKTDWCPHCHAIKPTWERVKQKMQSPDLVMVENDEERKPTPGIDAYPTIIKDVDGKKSKYEPEPNYTAEASLTRWLQD